jgi:hypothetical protein
MSALTRSIALLLFLLFGAGELRAGGVLLADGGNARLDIRLASGAVLAERTAAAELADYLTRISSAEFSIGVEGETDASGPAIHVGPTRFALRNGLDGTAMGPEEWAIRTAGDDLILVGGRPRGTLYAVYHLLEDHLGVRWWNPFEEQVPRANRLRLRGIDRRGQPDFAYRDVTDIPGPRRFCARNRMNGHQSVLSQAFGGMHEYGNKHVHNFYLYVPPEEFFGSHPEYFSEIGGLRFGGDGQLCLTNPELPALVAERIEGEIEQAGVRAAELGRPAPRLFALSQNDWGKHCDCAACTGLGASEGSRAGPLIRFVNEVADRLAVDHPEVLLDTIAYGLTFPPPRRLRTRDNVTVRVAALYQRDYGKPVEHPDNLSYREALSGWARATGRLRVWDYSVIFGEHGDLPLANLEFLGDDYRYYLEQGVEGLFVQHGDPIAADMRDLKLWVVLKLLEDTAQDSERLVRTFTDGYYGAAAPRIREYLRELVRRSKVKPARIPFFADASNLEYLDLKFIERAQRLFERALVKVEGDENRARRIRHARLSLDRATLYRLSLLEQEFAENGARGKFPLDGEEIVERIRATWYEQIEMRIPAADRTAARADVDDELQNWK